VRLIWLPEASWRINASRYSLIGGPVLSRFAPRVGFVTLRQIFVRHSHLGSRVLVGGSRMSNRSFSALNSEQGLASIPMAQGGLSRLAVARLESAGLPVTPLLKRVGLTPELIADPDERLSVQSQIRLLDEAAIALKDDCLGFTLARDFDPREIGLLYYVMASSQTLGDGLKRVARYAELPTRPWCSDIERETGSSST